MYASHALLSLLARLGLGLALVVDDEALARALLREYLAPHADIELVAECGNGFEAIKAIAQLAPERVFLDIQMPKLDGFEVAELAAGKARFVFVTASTPSGPLTATPSSIC
ncbi:chemotaxis response regulator CheB [Oxalobacteraceae bacterium GrIS 1.11]